MQHLFCFPFRVWQPTFEIGAYTYFASDLQLRAYLPGERVLIGSYCSIADQVLITTGGLHRTDAVSTYPFDFLQTYRTTSNTTIGNDVWIGTRSTVRGGVCVGDGAVIGSGSVVFSDVPAYAVVAGNPAAVVRYRFSRPIVARLLRIAWWNWPAEQVFTNRQWFYRPVTEFVDKFDPGEGAP